MPTRPPAARGPDHEFYRVWTARLAAEGATLAVFVRWELAASRADCHRSAEARGRSRAILASRPPPHDPAN
jgi:hypothetical protein